MYPQLQIWRPLVLVAALVAVSMMAVATVEVATGDTLSTIAARHDVTVAELVEWNDITNPDRIFIGDRLIVAAPESTTPAALPTASHVVTAGDTLSGIARRLGSTVGALVTANDLEDPNRIYIGQTIVSGSTAPTTATTVPPVSEARTHTVAAGDTLSSIAAAYDTKVGFIARDNNIDNPDRIRIGMVLIITEPAADTSAPTPTTTTTTTTAPAPAPTATVAPAPAPTPTTPADSVTRLPNEVLLAPMFKQWASTYNVSQDLLQAIAWKESTWRPDAVGPGGHLGLMQLSPDTATFVQQNLLGRELDPLTASDGLQLGARFLRYLLDRTHSEEEAVAAWFQGLDSVQTDGISTAGARYVASVGEIRAQWA